MDGRNYYYRSAFMVIIPCLFLIGKLFSRAESAGCSE